MAHIKDILDFAKDAATANSYDYLIASSLAEVNKASSRKYPLIMLVPPSTVDNPRGYGSHSFTVFVLNRLKNTTGDTLAHSNDKLHGAYKVLEDSFYAWLASLEALGGGGIVQVPFDSDVEISRLRDRQLQDELVGIQVQLTIYTTWYCGTDNPNLPDGGTCADATILNADGSSYLTVASGGSVQLTGVEVTGNTPISGTFNDGSTVSVSGFELTGRTAASGTFNDGSSYEVSGVNIQGETPLDGTDVFDGGVVDISGVTIAGNTPNTGVQQDGSTFSVSGVEVTGATSASGTYNDGSTFTVSGFDLTGKTAASGTFNDGGAYEVSGVEITGNTSASGTYNDGSVFTVSGCTVNDDDGNTYNLNDGESQSIYRCRNSVQLNGTTQYITIPYDASYNIGTSTPFSISLWVRIDNISNTQDIFSVGTPNVHLRFWYQKVTNKLQIQFADSGGNFLQHRYDPPSTNTWIHYTITKSAGLAASTLKLYDSGSELTPIVSSDNLNSAVDPTQDYALGRTSFASANFLDGNISEVRIYDKVLSLAEIQAIYNSGTPTTRDGDELGHWFKEDSTDDLVGSNDATLVNSPPYSTNRP